VEVIVLLSHPAPDPLPSIDQTRPVAFHRFPAKVAERWGAASAIHGVQLSG